MYGKYKIPDLPGMVRETLVSFPNKTVEDFDALPEGTRAQLIDGELVMLVSPMTDQEYQHGTVRETLAYVPNQTMEDFDALPEGTPAQLINGDLVMSPAPSVYHQIIVTRLVRALGNFVVERALGEVVAAPLDVQFNDTSVFQPDVLYIPRERFSIEAERSDIRPALVVEVLSPSTTYYDLVPKYKVYEESGVEEYWIVDPKTQHVRVHVNGSDGFSLLQELTGEGTIRSAILEGLEIDATQLFAKP